MKFFEFMFWQWQTIHRNRATEYNDEYNEDEPTITLDMEKNNFGGMIGRLKKEMPFDYISNYLNIFNLRQHGKIKSKSDSSDKFVTEQIYVHAKMMIIDDQIAIIGTANLNDRSLLGDLDSEMAAIIIDEDTEISEINGKRCEVRKFARDLRMKLWSEHLGIAPEDMEMITDPVIDATHEFILNTANSNTTAFEMAFPGIPSNNYSTIKSQIDAQKTPTLFEEQKKHTDIIKGYLVHFPLLWLWQEQGIADSWRPDSFYS